MRIIHQGDIHLRSSRPVNRIDDYIRAQTDKFHQLLEFSMEYDAPVLCSGDLCDAPEMRFSIFNPIQSLLRSGRHAGFYVCTGNHDLFFHNQNKLADTAFWGLVSGDPDVHLVRGITELEPNVLLHGVGWEEEVSEPIPGNINILLAHISVFAEEVPFYWKGEGYTPNSLRKKYPGFDWYLCGDIHDPVVNGGVNVSGSMMRQNINQIDYKPRCYLIDLDTSEVTPLYYDIKDEVFTIPEKQVKEDLNLDALVSALETSELSKVTYKRDCLTLAEKSEPVKQIIEEVFDGLS